MSSFSHDLLFALRQLVKHRVYAITAIVSMALGIAATTAVYSVLYGVLIDPYPYRDANRIAMINLHDKQGDEGNLFFTLAEIQQLRGAKSVSSVLGVRRLDMISTDGDLPVSVKAYEFTGNGFQFLDAPPMLGRTFTAQEAPEGVAPPAEAVISFLFWKTHFNQSSDVIGKSLDLNHRRFTVIGVVGPRFTWGDGEVYMPLSADVDPQTRLNTLVRVKPGVTLGEATGEINGFVRQLAHEHRDLVPPGDFDLRVETLNDSLLGQFKGTLFLLFAAVGLLLLIGCGNVSILMLARGTARQQELAMRAALGAARLRIVRQLLTEAVLLSVTGGVLGMALAYLAIHLIIGLLPEYSIPHEVVISLNIPVLLFSAAVSVAIGIAAGLTPALQFSRPQLNAILQAGDSRTVTSRGGKVRSVMIVAQVALTVLLLAGAGAAMRNFLEAYTAKLGFDPHNSLLMFAQFPEGAYTTWAARSQYVDALNEKIKATPGVLAATEFDGGLPPQGVWRQPVHLVGAPADDGRKAGVMMVSADYFAVQRIPLLQGRTITREEVLRGSHLAVITETFVKRYFDGQNPIGRQVVATGLQRPFPRAVIAPNPEQPYEIVGVVGDVRNDGLHEPIQPQIYVPSTIVIFTGTSILVRTAGDPRAAMHSIGASMRALNQNQAVTQEYAFEDFLSIFAWSHDRFISILFSIFSVVALGLAAIGLFSVVAYSVEQRTREIGIRIALGAPRVNVLILTLTSVAWTAGIGLLLGIGLSVGLSDSVHRWTQSSMRDAGVLGIISGVFLLASAAACILPARRAMRVNPMVALRSS
ncbi:putative permease [Granulicella aggregans]|uniref:Putative permease n=1 Tax=Granulicella aggregans TaxID=474949 RepID=A0A7W8E697_9BACT|nr:putative permease [Granulicella aggregans]